MGPLEMIQAIFSNAWEGAKAFWPYLMQMPVSTAIALGFTSLVLILATWILSRLKRSPVDKAAYVSVWLAIVITWLAGGFSLYPLGIVSEVLAGTARVTGASGALMMAFFFVQTLFFARRPVK